MISMHEDKHLQAGSIMFTVHSQACPKYPKQKVVISLQYIKKKGVDEVDFCTQTNKQSYKLIPLILVCMAMPAQIAQNNKRAKSLQYLSNEVRGEIDF